ncbi:tether containing UBX domain for GLUT4 isoform X5 [Suricata suricatta]|uniref:tether containing UBX domain for GLUT4 isoform X5 n=1 Tax=Suricata suricatta TaxID=37032 RepID=UPI0011553659|nr:tether containing UBX domain for GLUT4 isoform X5 [Suricata suricatta]
MPSWRWSLSPGAARGPRTRECLEQQSEASPVCVYMRNEVTGRASLQSTTLKSLGLTGGSAIIRFSAKRCRQEPGVSGTKTPGSPTSSLSTDQPTGAPLLPQNSVGLSQGDVSHQDEVGTSGASRTDAQAKQILKEPSPTPFVPFSGGGQRLGGSSGSGRSMTSPSAKLPKSFSSPGGPSKPKKSRPGQEPRSEPEPPVDRDPVVCHPDLGELLQAWPAELPDEFFEVTVDDVRRRLAQLKSERKRLEEAPLVTKAFREAQMREKLERYPKVVLRVLFPDRYILQGFFRPNETVGDLRDFVRSHLGNPELPFYLFITPPKTVLDDHTLTLFQADSAWWALPFAGVCFGPTLPMAPKAPEGALGCCLSCPSSLIPGDTLPPATSSCLLSSVSSAWSCGGLREGWRPRPPAGRAGPARGRKPSSLVWANLFPAALVHFGAEEPTGQFLEPRLLEHTVSPSAADVLVARCMSRAAGAPAPMPAPDPGPLEVEPTAVAGAVGLPEPREPSPGMAQPVRRDLGKVPKWLKLPASKR